MSALSFWRLPIRLGTIGQSNTLRTQFNANMNLVYAPNEVKAAFAGTPPDPQTLHQYIQIVSYVRDAQGQPVNDYFPELFSPDQAGNEDAVYFHQKVLDDVHVNSQSSSRRCLFVDRTDLMYGFYNLMRVAGKRELAVRLSAAPLGDNIRYFDSLRMGAVGHIPLHYEDTDKPEALDSRLNRNTTHLIEVIIPRQPIDKVFNLSQ